MQTPWSGTAVLLALVLLTPAAVEAQAEGPRDRGPAMTRMALDPVAAALERSDELELSEQQRRRLESFHESWLERTEEARSVMEARREARRSAMEERRRELRERNRPMRGPGAVRPPRGEMGPGGMEMDQELRDAIQVLRSEREEAMTELRDTLSPEQLQELREALRSERARPRGMMGRGSRGGPAARSGTALRAPSPRQHLARARAHRMMARAHTILALSRRAPAGIRPRFRR